MDDPSSRERDAISAVLDVIVPPSRARGMPGAGELGLADVLAEAARANPALQSALAQGLGELDTRARERGAAGFTALASELRAELVRAVAASQPGFVPNLLFPTYTAYYRHPRVLEALGLEPRPPFPKGHEMEPFDERLVDTVRRRSKLYRDC